MSKGNSTVSGHIGGSDKQKEAALSGVIQQTKRKIEAIFDQLPFEFYQVDCRKLAYKLHRVLPVDYVLTHYFGCIPIGKRRYRKPEMTFQDISKYEQNKQDLRVFIERNPGKSAKEIATGLGWSEGKTKTALLTMKDEIYNGFVLKPK